MESRTKTDTTRFTNDRFDISLSLILERATKLIPDMWRAMELPIMMKALHKSIYKLLRIRLAWLLDAVD